MLRAMIFDFDGVIADSEPLHFRAFRDILHAEGLDLSERRYYEAYLGFADRDLFIHGYAENGRPLDAGDVDALVARKSRRYLELVERELVILPGVEPFVRSAAARWPLAICSGALRREIETILELAGLRACFGVIVSADDVDACKPDPAGYLLALERLNATDGFDPPLRAAECLVVEDSLPGLAAADAAGMPSLAVASSHDPHLLADKAHRVVATLDEVTPDHAAAMFE